MEYWIDDSDNVTYCDTDMGIDVPSHEMVAATHCIGLLQAALELCDDPAGICEEVAEMMQQELESCYGFDFCQYRENLNNKIDHWLESGRIDDDQSGDIDGYLMHHLIKMVEFQSSIKIHKKVPEYGHLLGIIYSIANDHYDGDAREFMVIHFNWIRVCQNNFDIKHLTNKNIDRILNFIYDDQYNLDKPGKTYNLSISEPRYTYVGDIPLEALSTTQSVRDFYRQQHFKTMTA